MKQYQIGVFDIYSPIAMQQQRQSIRLLKSVNIVHVRDVFAVECCFIYDFDTRIECKLSQMDGIMDVRFIH